MLVFILHQQNITKLNEHDIQKIEKIKQNINPNSNETLGNSCCFVVGVIVVVLYNDGSNADG